MTKISAFMSDSYHPVKPHFSQNILCLSSVPVPRSSHRRCSVKRDFIKSLGNFTRKHLCWSLFQAYSGWAFSGLLTFILQWWNLEQSYLTYRRSKNYMNHVTHPWSSADISIFYRKSANFAISRNTDIDSI